MKIKTTILVVGIVAVLVALLAILHSNSISEKSTIKNITIESSAPDYSFILGNGTLANLATFKGHMVLLWFVATWCSSCAQGNIAINRNHQFFKQRGIKIVELELYKDLGYSGPPITGFVSTYAPSAYSNGTIVPALADYNMTATYDPHGYPDIYYLISSGGKVLYINGSPATTLGLLAQAINEST